MAIYETTIKVDEETIFIISYDEEKPEEYKRSWMYRELSDISKHTKALLELNKIGYEIAQNKIKYDEARIVNSKDTFTFG